MLKFTVVFFFAGVGDHQQAMADEEEEVIDLHLLFTDEKHQANTLAALNKMRKNRHFCDVILHVCALTVQQHILQILVIHLLRYTGTSVTVTSII